jgi:magnesium chelatase family protein
VALAHNGMLFFDELPHFPKNILEALREPLQDRRVNISRVNAKVEYEADIMFVSAMNPCPCGNLLSKRRACRCSEQEIRRYKNRLSDPFLDRIDLFVTMQEISADDKKGISSKEMKKQVNLAFRLQKERGQERLNGKLRENEIEEFCELSHDAQTILFSAVEKFGLSHRSLGSIKKVARTVADLIGSKSIEEATLVFRSFDVCSVCTVK